MLKTDKELFNHNLHILFKKKSNQASAHTNKQAKYDVEEKKRISLYNFINWPCLGVYKRAAIVTVLPPFYRVALAALRVMMTRLTASLSRITSQKTALRANKTEKLQVYGVDDLCEHSCCDFLIYRGSGRVKVFNITTSCEREYVYAYVCRRARAVVRRIITGYSDLNRIRSQYLISTARSQYFLKY